MTRLFFALKKLSDSTRTGTPAILTPDECQSMKIYLDGLLSDVESKPPIIIGGSDTDYFEYVIDVHLN